ncbi:MAG: thioredoxin domain-containing protein [Alphaproteobacteria bacterium]
MSRNLLDRETSPYLLQHKDNPVHWRPWGREALDEARRENKPVLLSIGYAACHWCHVMAHESFEDPETAAVMNRLFVNIKVDREERPDIDAIYMTALQMMGEPGGWPLTMFLTPDGEPFWGGTYFPRTPRFGRPGFVQVLERVAELYRTAPDKIAQNRDALRDALQAHARESRSGQLTPDMPVQAARRVLTAADPANGGIGQAPKFPNTGLLELIWRGYLHTGEAELRDAVTKALDHMSQGGIYDHLGGGFARYSVDERWLVPHFEKMLYDNAQLLHLMTLVWQETGSPLYEARIAETAGWVLREMIAEGGGFAATIDADSEGEEGAFYVWREAEIDALLPEDDAALFKSVYDVTPGGNWEGKTILNRLGQLEALDAEKEERLARCREILFEAREKRERPGWDDKVLADWNGLMIEALAFSGHVFGQQEWLEAAERAFRFVAENMGEGGRLHHSWRLGRALHPATAEGYANMSRAALTLHQITGEADYLDRAKAWTGTLDRHFRDDANGGYFLTADDAEALIVRMRSVFDGATPNANGIMISVLTILYHLTGDDAFRSRAEELLHAFAGEIERNLAGLASFLCGYDLYEHPVQIVILGRRGEADTVALLKAATRVSVPNRILQVIGTPESLPLGHPAAGKTMLGDQSTAYVCKGPVCRAPVTEAGALTRLLRDNRAA